MKDKGVWAGILLTALVLAFSMLFLRGGFADEVKVGTAFVCDTEEQVREFIALDGDADALKQINADGNVCGVLTVMYDGFEVVGQIQTPQGLGEIRKINIIGIKLPFGWVTAGEPMVQYTIVVLQGRDA